MENNAVKRGGLTTFSLKIIGMILMVVDHVHQMFAPFGVPTWVDWFGRPVALIFFFVSVVGFSHTHSKRAYMMRLYLWMIFMAFFTSGLEAVVHFDQVVLMNNIFRDLFIGTVFMAAVDEFQSAGKDNPNGVWKGMGWFLLPFISSIILMVLAAKIKLIPHSVFFVLSAVLPSIVTAENGIMVLIIPILYILRDRRLIQVAVIAVVAMFFAVAGSVQWMMVFAIIPIWFYNGQKGPGMKQFFYIFYPAHIAILYIIAGMLWK